MAADVNATICAVDKAMDMAERYKMELEDIRGRLSFEIRSAEAVIDDAIRACEIALDAVYEYNECASSDSEAVSEAEKRSSALRNQLYMLQSLKAATEIEIEELNARLGTLYAGASDMAQSALYSMGDYIRGLNRISSPENEVISIPYRGYEYTYIAVIDSWAYPQTAEHITAAWNKRCPGQPMVFTLDRKHSDEKRKRSLKNIKPKAGQDRDEFPNAVFKEGGDQADVFYLDPADNRGSGSSLRHQLKGVPDGAKVKIRII